MPEPQSSLPPSLEIVKQDIDLLPVGNMTRSVKEHYSHLLQLAERLQRCGFDNTTIDAHVIGIFEHYKTQLLLNISEAPDQHPS